MSNDPLPDLFGLIEKTSYTGIFADVSSGFAVAPICAAFTWPDAVGITVNIARASSNSLLLSPSLDATHSVMI